MASQQYDLVIIGGGVSGSALLYTVSRYSNIQKIALLEKYDQVAKVNSHTRNNSQTLHCGDIETNYTVEKARAVKQAAQMIVHYASKLEDAHQILYRMPKMVLAVGDDEVAQLTRRAAEFTPHFPYMRLLDQHAIAAIEPNVALVDGKFRKENFVGFGCTDEYSGANFGALTQSFIREAHKQSGKQIDVRFKTLAHNITASDGGYIVHTSGGDYHAKAVVVAACGHSLLLAQRMGYGLEYSCLPVAGSFYLAPKLVNGKIYTLQNQKLPFAAIHADYDFSVDGQTRFGPTALLLPLLERYNYSSFPEFLRVLRLDGNVARVFLDLFKDADIRNYIFKNFLFEVPLLGKKLFLNDARKIVPALKLGDLRYAKHFGGVRPQLIDRKQRKLLLGESKINPGNGIIFNVTPSPGASSCLHNAMLDMRTIATHLGARVDEAALQEELLK